MDNSVLVRKAQSVAKMYEASGNVKIGSVGCALVTEGGNVFLGTSIVANCGIGFCAEHSAISSMVTHGEHVISKIVAVSDDGKILPPCGRCRELMYQISDKNLDASIVLAKDKSVKLKKLLPMPWQKYR